MTTQPATDTRLATCPADSCDHGVTYRCFENHETDAGCTAFYHETDMCCVGPDACATCHGLGRVLAADVDPRAHLSRAALKDAGLPAALLHELDLLKHLSDQLDLTEPIQLPLSMVWDREFSEWWGETHHWPEHVTDARGRVVLDLVGESPDEFELARLLAIVAERP